MKKRTKFHSIPAGQGAATPLLPGRERCDCQAAKHDLVNNCLSCGRIVCAQEGTGPCFFCGEIVMTKAERLKVMSGNSKDSAYLLSKYSKQKEKETEQLKLAQSQKEKLLDYDKNTVKRTKVIDDQSDYFAMDSPWISEDERNAIKVKKEAYLEAKNRLKRRVKVTIDFAGRRMIEEDTDIPSFVDSFNNLRVQEDLNSKNSGSSGKKGAKDNNIGDKDRIRIEPKFVGTLTKSNTNGDSPVIWSNRLQDSELQEMVDAGNCLTVSQPYASMIMEGIKLFEGRTWYTSVRGRLWIHAGKKPPTPELLEQVKAAYKNIVGDIEFPETFPLGCLLGCVDLVDCIPQEEYLNMYPNGEVADPYVFVLANPQILPVKLPMNGKLKIYKLEQHVHQAAKRALDKKSS